MSDLHEYSRMPETVNVAALMFCHRTCSPGLLEAVETSVTSDWMASFRFSCSTDDSAQKLSRICSTRVLFWSRAGSASWRTAPAAEILGSSTTKYSLKLHFTVTMLLEHLESSLAAQSRIGAGGTAQQQKVIPFDLRSARSPLIYGLSLRSPLYRDYGSTCHNCSELNECARQAQCTRCFLASIW